MPSPRPWKMIRYFHSTLSGRLSQAEKDAYSLEISSGMRGSKLSHPHGTHFIFVLQSLHLWHQITQVRTRAKYTKEKAAFITKYTSIRRKNQHISPSILVYEEKARHGSEALAPARDTLDVCLQSPHLWHQITQVPTRATNKAHRLV